jgi:phosphomethylpyrimidine synthase
MITPNDSAPSEAKTVSDVFPNSKRVYLEGKIHQGLLIPMREVELAETTHPNGRVEVNEPVRHLRHERSLGRS